MHYHLKINNNKKGKHMKKLSLLVFVMMVTWIVAGCSTTTSKGCFGFWVKNKYGLHRGTVPGRNADYKKPYRQCVDEDNKIYDKEKRPYG